VPITFLSLALAIAASTFALAWVSSGPLGFSKLLFGGVTMGAGIAAMHYTGMAAMKMEPPIRYDPLLFALSILIAVTAAIAALWCAFKLRMETFSSAFWKKAGSAVVMGTAIYGMHYAGMAAADFAPGSVSAAAPPRLEHTWLAITLGALALLFLLATLTMSALDSYIAAQSLLHERERLARDRRDHMIELASAVAHEINQPLAAIAANAGAGGRWLKAEPPKIDAASDALRSIASDAHRAGQVLARIRAVLGPRETRGLPVDMRGVVLDVLADVADNARNHGVALRPAVGRDLPEVQADRGQIHAVVLNFVENAIEAMTEVSGRERVLEVECRLEDPETLVVSVRDSGTGIAAEDRDRVFDPFYTAKRGAMGMGLAISRSIVEAHGGRLWVTPNDGHGVTFHFSLAVGRGSHA
jgi:signal transduction histidine kinase